MTRSRLHLAFALAGVAAGSHLAAAAAANLTDNESAMAKSGDVTAAKLADATSHGHQMSPITLSAEQIKALVAYIQTLR